MRAPVHSLLRYAPLAQWQSNGLLIRRFWVRIPGGAPPLSRDDSLRDSPGGSPIQEMQPNEILDVALDRRRGLDPRRRWPWSRRTGADSADGGQRNFAPQVPATRRPRGPTDVTESDRRIASEAAVPDGCCAMAASISCACSPCASLLEDSYLTVTPRSRRRLLGASLEGLTTTDQECRHRSRRGQARCSGGFDHHGGWRRRRGLADRHPNGCLGRNAAPAPGIAARRCQEAGRAWGTRNGDSEGARWPCSALGTRPTSRGARSPIRARGGVRSLRGSETLAAGLPPRPISLDCGRRA